MKSSALQAIFWVLLIFCNTVQTQPQTRVAKKEVAGSVSGKVTIKGKGAPGIVVGMRSGERGGFGGQLTTRYRATTDQDGNYKIINVGPGTYKLMPAAPAFVNSDDPGGKTLIITEAENVEGMDFTLARGGVITGKAVDSEGVPLIEEQIMLVPAEANNQIGPYMGLRGRVQTDDRGIYRIFGIAPGRYKVALGQSDDGTFGGGPRRSRYKQTFSPGVLDSSKAAVIEVTEGSETTNVDIVAGRSFATFNVSGRIVNGETLQPLPNIRLALLKVVTNGTDFMNFGPTSNSRGEFKIEHVPPGKYELLFPPQTNSGMRAETVPFEVIDVDVTGLLVKTAEGANLSGQVVFEGSNDRSALGMLGQVWLHTHVSSPDNSNSSNWVNPVTISSDGNFLVRGLSSGFANFSLAMPNGNPVTGLMLLRIEREGIPQPAGVEIKDGEQITGVRLVVRSGSGTIRGLVKIENGELPANAQFFVRITGSEEPQRESRTWPHPEVDSRGHFLVEGLAAGTYQIHASLVIPGSQVRPSSVTQQVNVVDGTVTEVSLTLSLAPVPGPGNP
jgi:hypothetical protein